MTHGSDPFPGTHVSHIIEKNGVKLGFYGLVGTDFVGTLNFDVSEFKVADAVECARTMEKKRLVAFAVVSGCCGTADALKQQMLWNSG